MTAVGNLRRLALEGGGVLGAAYVSFFEQLEPQLPEGLRSFKTVCGASAGAITGAAIAMGATGPDLRKIWTETNWARFADDDLGIFRDVFRVLRGRGWCRLDYAGEFLIGLCQRLAQRDVTFREVYELNGCELMVVAVNESRRRLEVFGPEASPDLPVWRAVLASMAIPFLYPAVAIGSELFSDGGWVANLPLSLLAQYPAREILAVMVDTADDAIERWDPPGTPIGRAVGLLKTLRRHSCQSHVPPALEGRIARLQCGRVEATDFGLSQADKDILDRAGRQGFERWMARLA